MSLPSFFPISFILCSLSCIAQALVPPSETFNYINEGEFGPYIIEYDASYRVLPLGSPPFQIFFYNTTPGEYTLANRIGTRRSESLRRWVWEANRGNPVGENATFSLGTDGNLVLAEANGSVVWQSNTANKDVVGINFLPNGNMALYDSKGKFVWQSFDSPTDTLLVGQSLRLNGRNKLVSRLSEKENKNGPYSLVLEPNGFAMYYKSDNSPNPMLYFKSTFSVNNPIDSLTFTSEPETDEAYSYDLQLVSQHGQGLYLSRPKYNSTFTILRLGIDGGLRALTFYNPVDYQAWEETYTLFTRDNPFDTIKLPTTSAGECQLPERCGKFGLCENSQCVACPSPNGLLGWSDSCVPPVIKSCKDVMYYKIEGVRHFVSAFTRGTTTKEADCQKKCTSDCKCAGFFINRAESRCWVVNELKTLTKVSNTSYVGFIKTPSV